MTWDVRLSKTAAKQLSKVPRNYQDLLLERLGELAEDPFRGDVKPLKGAQWQGRYRKRIGRWRIIFIPDQRERLVEISAILMRSEKTYR
jgi:mRNA-degrading endonuclease RelE of RelBE toxin-antitoxin system